MKTIELNDMLDPAIRAKLLKQHPLLNGSILLITPAVMEIYRQIKRAIIAREPGHCFSAESGTGKTRALRIVKMLLMSEMQDLVVYEHNTQNQQLPSIRAFFKNFLVTLQHKEMSGETYDLRNRVTNRMIDDGRSSGWNMVILLIDEAQAMSLHDFLFLKDIDNSLSTEGVNLVTILMGQKPDIDIVVRELHDKRRLDLVSRFIMRETPFRGYNSLEDIEQILNEIDTKTYPINSSVTWTQFFLPKAYAAGFRMKNEAAAFLDALKNTLVANQTISFPARPFFLAIRTFMLDNASFDNVEAKLPTDAWQYAVRHAMVQEALNLMNSSSPSRKLKVRR